MNPRADFRAGPVRRALRNVALACTSALAAFALTVSPGCGTSARGIQDCRDIEEARCTAAVACGIVAKANDCKIYYRDHCLHGLPIAPPQPADLDNCVSTITTLGSCVQANGRDVPLAYCGVDADNAVLACEVVQYPERAYACSFLTGTAESAPPATAGQGGQGGSE